MTGPSATPRAWLSAQTRFVLIFCSSAALLLLLYCFPYREHGISERGFDAFFAGYARLAHALIRLVDPSALVVGSEIHGRFSVRIIKGCDAMETNILFVSAVLAFPAKLPRKVGAALLGLLLLTALNLLRIASLYAAGAARPDVLELLHLEVWPFVMIAVAALLFLGSTTLMAGAEVD
jgi:exosortase/archaeosortase family protein